MAGPHSEFRAEDQAVRKTRNPVGLPHVTLAMGGEADDVGTATSVFAEMPLDQNRPLSRMRDLHPASYPHVIPAIAQLVQHLTVDFAEIRWSLARFRVAGLLATGLGTVLPQSVLMI